MSMNQIDQQALKERSYFKAIHLCGTQAALAEKMGVKPDVIYKFLKLKKVPGELAEAFQDATGIDRRCFLGRDLKDDSEKQQKKTKKSLLIEIPFAQIDVSTFKSRRAIAGPERDIIIDSDAVFISGSERFERYKADMKTMVSVLILDLESLFLERQSLKDIPYPFLLTELIEIGLRFEEWIGHHPGARHDLGPNRRRKGMSPCPALDEVIGRKDSHIAKILGFGSKSTYHNLKTVYRKGVLELMQPLNEGKIAIETAARMAVHPQAQQFEKLQTHLHRLPCKRS